MVNRKKSDLITLAAACAVIIVVNLLSSAYFTRLDFTAEKRYTLSPLTTRLLGELDAPLEVTVYLEGDFPAGFKRLRRSASDLLTDFKAYAGSDFNVVFLNPGRGNQQQQESQYNYLLEKGIEPTQVGVPTEGGVSQILIYPAALIRYKGKEIAVRLLPAKSGAIDQTALNNAVQNLEYAFVSAIKKVQHDGMPRVGFTEGHGELTDLQLNDALVSLRDGYEAGRIDLSRVTFEGLDKLKLLVISKPDQPFTEAEKYKIDYFVMKGGRVIWAIDNVSAEMDSLRGKGSQLVFNKELNLDDLLFTYGARINYSLIADMNCAQIPMKIGGGAGGGQISMVPWLFYPLLIPQQGHPLTKNLDAVRSEFASMVDTIAVSGIKKQVLLSSSPFSRMQESPSLISLSMVEEQPDPQRFRDKMKPVAVLLEGSFKSAFNNRPVPPGITGHPPLPAKGSPAKMIVIGDGDIFKNQVNSMDGSPFPLGYDRYSQQQYGNKNFLLNCVDFLTDDSGIISLRNKEVKVRLLDRPRIREEKVFWQVINIAMPLIIFALLGVFQHYYRKRKYSA